MAFLLWYHNFSSNPLAKHSSSIQALAWPTTSEKANHGAPILVAPQQGTYPPAETFQTQGFVPLAFVPAVSARTQAVAAGYLYHLGETELQDPDFLSSFLEELSTASQGTSWDSFAMQATILQKIKTATLATDPEGTVLFWNEEAEKLLGHPAGEVIGQNLQKLSVFAIPEPTDNPLQQNEKGKTLPFGEYLVRHKEGRIFPVEVRLSTLFDKQGQASAYVGTLHDIRSFKETEKQFRLRNFRYQRLLENNQDAIMVTDSEGHIQYVSDTVYFYTGYSRQQLKKKNALDLVHPDDRREVKTKLRSLEQGQKSVISKHRSYFRENYFRWVQATVVDERGTPGIDGFVCTFKDVHNEEMALQQLQEVNERFRYASYATHDVIWEYRIAENKLIWGENFDLIFGLGQKYPLTLEQWTQRIRPDARERVTLSFNKLLDGQQGKWEEEYHFRKASGEYSVVIDRGYVLFDEAQKPYRIVGAMQDVTRQRHYQNELAKSEEKFRKLFEKSLLGVTMTDINTGRWLDANQALVNMLGYPLEELTQLTSQEITPQSYHKSDRENRELMIKNGTYGPYQKELIRKDQQRINVVLSGFSATLPNGRKVAWHHILDLSPIEKTNQALQKVQQRFKHYVENASDVFIVLNEDGTYEYVSPNIKSLLGYTADEVEYQHNLEFIHPEDQPLVDEVFQKALAQIGSSHRSHFRGLHKEGHPVWVEANGRFIHDQQGKLQAHLLVRKMPISREEQERLRLLARVADKTTNAVIITDAQQRIEWVNQSFTHYSGYSLEEARGKTPTELLHQEDSPEEMEALQDKLQGAEPFYHETVNYHKNGRPYWIESYVTPIFDEEGKLSQFIAIENNITERRENWQQLEKSLEKSRRQSERLENFAHIISHNFRAYCANIMGLAEELPHHPEGESRREMEASLRHTAQLLMDALEKLGDILRLPESDQLKLEKRKLQPAVEAVVSQFSQEVTQLQAEIEVEVDETIEIEICDAYFESVLHNLISNALRYRHPDRAPQIRLTAAITHTEIELQVSDNGLGINLDKHREKLFQMRQSIHNHPESKGIGLYLAQGQMRAMHGYITVQSKLNQGSTFVLHFPRG